MSVSIDGSGSITGIDQGFNVTGGLTVSGVSTTADIHVNGGVQVGTGATINGSTNTIIASTNGSERLRVTSDGEVLINKTTSPTITTNFVVGGASPISVYTGQQLIEGSETSGAADTGGALMFGGHDGSTVRNWANIYGMKENGTGGNRASYMSFHTRPAGGAPTERIRIGSAGQIGIGGSNYGSSGQVLTSQGSSSAVQWATVSTGLSFYFHGKQDTQHDAENSAYRRIRNLGTRAINQGDASIATWNESVGTLTIGASGTGYWFLAGGTGVDDISSGDYMQTVIGKNGSATTLGTEISTIARSFSPSSNVIIEANVTTIAYLEDGDVVGCYIYQAGTGIAQPTEPNRCFFMGYKMMT